MTRRIVAISTRPSPNSKTSRILRQAADMAQGGRTACAFHEMTDFAHDLRGAASRIYLSDKSALFLDDVENAVGLIIGVSMKSPSGYPALLRHLLEMADPDYLKGKPVALLKAHCNTSEPAPWEAELDLCLDNFGLARVSELRLASSEMLTGLGVADRRLERFTHEFRPQSARLVAVS